MTWMPLVKAEQIFEGQSRVFDAGLERIVVCRVEGTIYAIEDTCTHDDGPLGEGTLSGYQIECPRHGARFDVRSGAVVRMPAVYPVRTFPVRVSDGTIEVEIGED